MTDMAKTNVTPVADEGSDARIRQQVQGWIADHWSPDIDPKEWRKTVVDAGWAVPSWSTEHYGLGLKPEFGKIILAEFKRLGVPNPGLPSPDGDGHVQLLGNAILAHGSEKQKRDL